MGVRENLILAVSQVAGLDPAEALDVLQEGRYADDVTRDIGATSSAGHHSIPVFFFRSADGRLLYELNGARSVQEYRHAVMTSLGAIVQAD